MGHGIKTMGITKISHLFIANVDAVPAVTPSKAVTPQSAHAQKAPQASTDAAIVSMHRVPLQDADSARAAKVDQLKQQVKSGTYKPNQDQVAVSILRDLA
jgi:anti-sigma28 factor (negative regulator of flagellin synthesis)